MRVIATYLAICVVATVRVLVTRIGGPREDRDTAVARWPDVPGLTINTPSTGATHTTSLVSLNSDYTWNTSGTMNQSQRKTDVRTVAVHEIGHSSGLHHPSVCGAMTQAEIDSAMNPNWVTKQSINSDDKAGIGLLY